MILQGTKRRVYLFLSVRPSLLIQYFSAAPFRLGFFTFRAPVHLLYDWVLFRFCLRVRAYVRAGADFEMFLCLSLFVALAQTYLLHTSMSGYGVSNSGDKRPSTAVLSSQIDADMYTRSRTRTERRPH